MSPIARVVRLAFLLAFTMLGLTEGIAQDTRRVIPFQTGTRGENVRYQGAQGAHHINQRGGQQYFHQGASRQGIASFQGNSTSLPRQANLMPEVPGEFTLKIEHGPWLIYAANFQGAKGMAQAIALAKELKSHNLKVYLYDKEFDFSGRVQGNVRRADGAQVARKNNTAGFNQVAVLVGDFHAIDDLSGQKMLANLRNYQPVALRNEVAEVEPETTRYSRFVNRQTGKVKGPLSRAFITRNPLLPETFFINPGVDEFVQKMNKPLPNSLLNCRGKYTVRVASFKGVMTVDAREMLEMKQGNYESRLAIAAEKAHVLTLALRKQKIEAYEFHDRDESIVCVGSFDSLPKRSGPNGDVYLGQVQTIIDSFSAQVKTMPNGLKRQEPRTTAGAVLPGGLPIFFDYKAVPIPVPKVSAKSALFTNPLR
ncbi:MAG: hypothetical protein MPJ24_01580 [Pirellulaceae bacterium]|nr:hypothetical protein [Pirellulaceae bacterium]